MPPRTRAKPPLRGLVPAICAVTGVEDEVDDVILPGAFTKTLATRPVKPVFSHEWKDPIGVCHKVEEWMPGDPRLPKLTPRGEPWPKEAGALVADVGFNMRTQRGRDTFEQVKQWHEEGGGAQWSIGYVVPKGAATKRGGVRFIHDLTLYEVSPVLHGAHPLTMALEIKSAQHGGTEGMEYKATPAPADISIDAEPDTEDAVTVAGLVVKAADTSRVLMIQRALDDDDPAAGTWEIPGGHLEEGEDPLTAALREWQEETGSKLPGTTSVVGSWTAPNGIYRGYVAVIPSESAMPINVPHDERRVDNPDDPDGEATEVTAWWPITALPDMSLLRSECRETPWSLLAGATLPQDPTAKPSPAAQGFAEEVMRTFHALGGGEKKTAHQAVMEAKGLHPYQRLAQSNAGNCECGMAEQSTAHPHVFTKSRKSAECVCSRPAADSIHTAGPAMEVKTARMAVAAARITSGLEVKTAHQAVMEAKSLLQHKAAGGADKNRGQAEQLRHWYVNGAGAALISWGSHGDFDRCVAIAGKHMSPKDAKGYCNLRHHDALGIYPATHAAMDHGTAHKDAGTPALEEKIMPGPMPGSYEAQRRAITDAVRTLFLPNETDGDGDIDACGYVCVEATYPDHVIVTAEKPNDSDGETYSIPYEMQGEDVVLGQPQAVELVVVAVPDTDDAEEGDNGDGQEEEATPGEVQEARFLTPAGDHLDDATSALAVADVEPVALEALRPKLVQLLSTLAKKGMPLPHPADITDDGETDWTDGWDTPDDGSDPATDGAGGNSDAAGDTGEGDNPDAAGDAGEGDNADAADDGQVTLDPADLEKELAALNA